MHTDRYQSISGPYTAATEHKQWAFPRLTRVCIHTISNTSPRSPIDLIAELVTAGNYSPNVVRKPFWRAVLEKGYFSLWGFILGVYSGIVIEFFCF